MHAISENTWKSIFVIMGVDLDPLAVSAVFDRTPDESRIKGDINPLDNTPYGGGMCTYHFNDGEKMAEIEEHLVYWVDFLKDHSRTLAAWRQQDYELFIECWITTNDAQYIDIEPVLLTHLADLSVELLIEIYPIDYSNSS